MKCEQAGGNKTEYCENSPRSADQTEYAQDQTRCCEDEREIDERPGTDASRRIDSTNHQCSCVDDPGADSCDHGGRTNPFHQSYAHSLTRVQKNHPAILHVIMHVLQDHGIETV